MTLYIILAVIAGLAIGYTLANTALKKGIEAKSAQLLKDAEMEAEVLKKDKILQAKEKFIQLKGEHETYVSEKNQNILVNENRIKQKEQSLNAKIEDSQRKQKEMDSLKETMQAQIESLNKKQAEVDKGHKRQLEQLETIAGLKAEEAKAAKPKLSTGESSEGRRVGEVAKR